MKDLIKKNSFKQYLVDNNLLDDETSSRILVESREQQRSIVELILSKGLMPEENLRDILADYSSLKIGEVPFGLALNVYQFINYIISYRYRVVAFDVKDDYVKIATDNPLDLQMREIIDFLARAKQVKIDIYIVTHSEIVKLVKNYESMLIEEGLLDRRDAEILHQKFGNLTTEVKQAPLLGKEETAEESDSQKASGELQNLAESEVQLQEIKISNYFESDYSVEQKTWLQMLKQKVESLDELKKIVNSRDIPRLVAAFVHYAIFVSASDIHIESLADKIRVRFRVDGVLQQIMELDKALAPALVSRIKILALLKIDEHRIPQDGQFRVIFEGRMVDLRISSLPTVYGEKVVIRILDVSGGKLTLDQLGVQGLQKIKLERNIHRTNGMILSTGPTGSGKSTTLFSILGIVSVPGVNVITLEDPVEYHIPGVNQCQVNSEIGFSFAKGLRSILRQDPNIIMVGEIRDTETAELAVHASLTGHLVLSTLHTNDAPSAVPRLIDMDIEPFLITSSLILVMAQRLVRKMCDHCRQEVKVPQEKINEVLQTLKNVPKEHLDMLNVDLDNIKFYKGLGCPYCRNSGYAGRIAVFEIMEMTDAIQELAIKKVSGVDIFNQAVKDGMVTMRQDGFLKAMQGITSLDEVYRVTTK